MNTASAFDVDVAGLAGLVGLAGLADLAGLAGLAGLASLAGLARQAGPELGTSQPQLVYLCYPRLSIKDKLFQLRLMEEIKLTRPQLRDHRLQVRQNRRISRK